jgi:hypothetical protein
LAATAKLTVNKSGALALTPTTGMHIARAGVWPFIAHTCEEQDLRAMDLISCPAGPDALCGKWNDLAHEASPDLASRHLIGLWLSEC